MRRVDMAKYGNVVIFVVCFCINNAFAQGRWERATNISQSLTGDPMLVKCFYQTLGGFEFSIIVRGICPFSIEINPETGQWKK